MPFKKVGDNDYTGPTGRHFNGAQVRLYYARGGHFEGGGSVSFAKGSKPEDASYAQGGAVLGRTREFLKEGDTYIGNKLQAEQPTYKNPQDYGDNKSAETRSFPKRQGKSATIRTKNPGPNVVPGNGSKGRSGL